MFGLGPGEIVGILMVLLLLFGAKRLPELARGLGQSLGEFRKSLREPVVAPAAGDAEESRAESTRSG